MRCKNCGWENPDTATRCVKCNSVLSNFTPDLRQTERQAPSMGNENLNLKSTVREVQNNNEIPVNNTPQENSSKQCHKCGYPLADNMDECPMCGSYQNKENFTPQQPKVATKNCPSCGNNIEKSAAFCPKCGHKFQERSGTINNWVNPSRGVFCTLKPIAWENEGIEYNPISYSGDRIVLNRSNTDANNNSITSKEQAILSFDNNEWYIENASEMKTTLIQINGKTKLKDGDIIVLGNRLFEFKG